MTRYNFTALPAIGFGIYLLFLTLARVGLRTSSTLTILFLVGLACYLGCVALAVLLRDSPSTIELVKGSKIATLAVIFFTLTCVSSVVAADSASHFVTSIGYAVLTATVFVAGQHVWSTPPRSRTWWFTATAVTLVAIEFSALMAFGVGTGRFVGRMTPNHFANVALTAAILATFGHRWFILPIWFSSAYLVIAVNSRGSALVMGIFVLSLLGLLVTTAPKRLRLSGGKAKLVMALIAILGVGAILWPAQSAVISSYFAIDDPERGIGSGFTGRSEMWGSAISDIAESPVFGYGFRASTRAGEFETSHSGYLDLARDVGIPLSVLWLIITLLSLGLQLRRAARDQILSMSDRIAAVAPSAAILALSVNAALEIHVMNLGFPLAILFMLCVAAAGTESYGHRERSE